MKLTRFNSLLPLVLFTGTMNVATGADQACDVRQALERAALQLSAGRADAALHALSCVSETEPNNPWLWYYTGAAHLQLGNTYLAIENLARALDLLQESGMSSAGLFDRAGRLHRKAQRSVLQVSLRMGMAYDTNVSFLDDSALREDIIAGEEDGLFESRLTVSFAPIKTRDHSLTFGAEATNTAHFRIDEFDIMATAGFARYAFRLDGASEVSAQYEFDIIDLDNRPYLTRNALTLAWRYEWPRAKQTMRLVDTVVSYGIEDQDFHYRVARDFRQDGLVQSIGVLQRIIWHPVPSVPWECTGRLGYIFSEFDTDGREYDRRSHRAMFDVELPLLNPSQWDEFLIIPDKPAWLAFVYDWEYARYSGSNATERDSRKRRDRTSTYGLTLSQVLSRGQHRDLLVHFHARWTDADSNVRTANEATPFTFDKFVVGVQFEWSW